jgi:hypothetical protein
MPWFCPTSWFAGHISWLGTLFPCMLQVTGLL